MKPTWILLLITQLILTFFVGCKDNSISHINAKEKNAINKIPDNILTETEPVSIKTFSDFTDTEILSSLSLPNNGSNKILSTHAINNSLEIILLSTSESYCLKKYNLVIEDNKLKLNDSLSNGKSDIAYDKLRKDISSEVNYYFSNVYCNYSLLFADINNPDYIWSSNYSTDIQNTMTSSASVIKIFVMIEAYNQVNKSTINLDSTIILTDDMKVGGSGVLSSEPSGIEVTIDQLIYLMITESDNTATNILIDILGMDNINTKIKELGCVNTMLNNKLMATEGLDNYTSVYDLYLTLMQLYYKKCINEFYDSKMLDIMKCNKSTTKIPSLLPDDVIVAHKTGEYDGTEHDAGIIYTKYGDYILCILTENGSNYSEAQAISDISKNIYDLFNNYKSEAY